MTSTTFSRNGDTITHPQEATEGFQPADTTPAKAENRWQAATYASRIMNGNGWHREDRPVLAVFCFESPDSAIGRYAAHTAAALARRHTAVHLFARHDFAPVAPGVAVYPVGDCSGDDLPGQVDEFAHRACKAFLEEFPFGPDHVALMGYEWSSVPALSILRGIKNTGAILALHSLERQRSDMSGDLSKRIEEIELAGLRGPTALLVHEPATAEIAKYWVPECAGRIVPARPMFPVHQFDSRLDAGEVKARYRVGPVDPTILYVGDLSERYGPDLLMKSMPAVLKNHKQARLIVVGDGALYWPLRVYARYLLLEHAVRLVGSMEGQALNELVQAADVIAVPSREQTPWWPVLAAWAARRPVVATREAAPTLLEHEQDSVLVYPSENSCVWGIERVLFDPEFGRKIAEQGYQKLEERFGWNCLADQVEELMGVGASR